MCRHDRRAPREGGSPSLLVVPRQLEIVALSRHADGDVSDPGPRVEPGPKSVERAIVRRRRAPGEAEGCYEEPSALIEHAAKLPGRHRIGQLVWPGSCPELPAAPIPWLIALGNFQCALTELGVPKSPSPRRRASPRTAEPSLRAIEAYLIHLVPGRYRSARLLRRDMQNARRLRNDRRPAAPSSS